MKKLTKKERKKIYSNALALLKTRNGSVLCWCLGQVMGMSYYFGRDEFIKENLPEFMLFKPQSVHFNARWLDISTNAEECHEMRRTVLELCIAMCD